MSASTFYRWADIKHVLTRNESTLALLSILPHKSQDNYDFFALTVILVPEIRLRIMSIVLLPSSVLITWGAEHFFFIFICAFLRTYCSCGCEFA